MPLRLLAALLAVLLTPCPARAQDAPPPAADEPAMTGALDSVVVTASRVPMAARATGRRVTVLTAADLAAQPAASLDEVLRTTAGVEIQSRGGFGVQSDFTIRGSNFKGVLVLLDGMPINDPQTGHYLSDFPVPLASIARIEVLRGPASALYGPDAVGGVVQILTHAGLQDAAADPAAEGHAAEGHAQLGAHAFYDAGGAVRASAGRATLSAAAVAQGTHGERVTAGSAPVTYPDGDAVRTDFARQAATAALSRPLGSARFYVRAGVDRRDFGAYHFYTDFDSDRARSDNHTYWAQARLQNSTERATRWQVHAAAKQHEGLYVYNPQFESSRDYSRLLRVQAQASRALAPSLRLTGGASGQARGIASATLGDHGDLGGGAFLAAQWQPATRLTVHGSGRLDYDDAYGLEATPQASLAYDLPLGGGPALTLRAAAGRAVRAPTYTERYIDTEVEEPAGNLGNPDLDAERAWSYEAGADLYASGGLALHATAFYRTTDDFIDYARRPGEDLFVAQNILRAQTRGLELEAALARPLGDAARLHLTAAYTRLGASFDTGGGAEAFKYALTSARHLVQSTARLTAGPVTAGVRSLWKDRRAQPSYGVVHGRLAVRLPTLDGRLAATLEVRNLFDAAYAEVFDAPLPGRWWIAGLRLRP